MRMAFDSGAVGGILSPRPQPFIARQRGSLGDTQKNSMASSRFIIPLVVEDKLREASDGLAFRQSADVRRWNNVRFPASSVQ